MDEFSFPANPSASHVTIAAGIPRRDTASKPEEQGGQVHDYPPRWFTARSDRDFDVQALARMVAYGERECRLCRALEAIGSFFRRAKRLGRRARDRKQD